MSGTFIIVAAVFVTLITVVLLWAVRASGRKKATKHVLGVLDSAPHHLCNMTSVRQALGADDIRYVMEKGGSALAGEVRRDRRRIAVLYLEALRRDFESLLRIARVAASLSPEISAPDEYQRLRLSLTFYLRFNLLRLRFLLGDSAMPGLHAIGEMVTSLAVQMETAMSQLGEKAVLAAELALQSEQ